MSAWARFLSRTGIWLLATCCVLLAQSQTTARIAGTVHDATDAAILKAEVVAENSATGEKRSTVTDETGDFVLASISPGNYEVTISASGFSSTRYANVQAGISGTLILNAVLRVASSASEVTVTSAPPLLRSEDAEIGISIDSAALSGAPLPTRNFLQLSALVPGVSTPLSDNSTIGRNSPNFSANGARTSQNNLSINGVDANDISAHDFASVAIPAPESISEVVVKTSMYDASVSGAGASVQLVTKSGTNSLQGELYEYLRNAALNANDPNLKTVGVRRPVLTRNVYGVTVGGPIRKDQSFFFVSYQGTREINGATDQSLYKSVLIAPVPPGSAGLTNDRSEGTLLNNFQAILPPGTTSLDPTSLSLLSAKLPDGSFLIPTPQQGGRVSGTAPSRYQEEQFNTNIDWHVSARDSLALKFFFADAPEFWALGGATFSGGSSLPGFGTYRRVNNRVLSLQDVHAFGPTTINEVRFGDNFIRTNESPEESVHDADIGMSRPTAGTFPGLPLILLARDSGAAGIGSSPITIRGTSPSLSVTDVLSFRRGKHNLRLGGEIRRYKWDAHANVNAYGEIDFATFDQFLLGQSDFSLIGVGLSDRNFRTSDYNVFLQDDWKTLHNLTLNLGLRYELDLPPYDARGRIGGFDPSLYQPRMEVDGNGFPIGPPVAGIVVAGNVGRQYQLPGVPRVSNSVLKSVDPNNFGPRIGLAWSPINSDRLVVRGGYGIFYSRPSFIYLGLDFFAPPFYATFLSSGQTFAHPFPTSLPENQFPVLSPGIALTGSVIDRNNRTPYVQHFNTSLEYQLAADTSFQVAYVGSQGMRLFRLLAANQARIASVNRPITNAVTGEVITSNTPENAALRAPFQGTDMSFFALNQTSAQSNYNSLQISLNHRASHGVELQAAYTFSKSIDNASNAGGGAFSDGTLDRSSGVDTGNVIGNQFNARSNRGLSDFDRTHHMALSWVWAVPSSSWVTRSPVKRVLFSNWQLSGLTIAMSGLPVDTFDSTGGDLYGLRGSRPNWAPGATRKTATTNIPKGYKFNPFAFALPLVAPNQPIPSANDPTALAPNGGNDFGNVDRNVLRGPFQSAIDLSIAKGFLRSESKCLELRADFFNALNHASLSNPVSDIMSAEGFDAEGSVANPGDFGRSVRFDSSPRIVQLSLKIAF